MGYIILGRQNYIQQTHLCLSRVILRFRWLLKSSKTNHHILNKFLQNCLNEGRTIRSEIHKLISSVLIRRNCLRSGRSRSLYLFVSSVIKHCSIYRGILVLSTVYKILSNIILLSRLSPYEEELLGIISLDFERNRSTTDHIFYIRQILEKKWDYK